MSETVTTPADSSGNSPGAVLKRCREFHNITLEEASQTTKIGISHIKSLEADQISAFANLTYLKGFLRIYATYLGLNPDDMARMFDKLYGARDGRNNLENGTSKSGRRLFRLASLQKLALPAVLLLLILITASLFKRQPAPIIRPLLQAAAPSPPIPVSSVQDVFTSAKRRKAPPVIEESNAEIGAAVLNTSDKQQSINPAEQPKRFILKISVTQNCNLNAAVDGSGSQLYELSVGDIIEWKVEKSVALDLSNAGAVNVELNGKPLKQIGAAGKPAYVVIGFDGIKP